MSWTKRELINQAFDEAGLASFVADLEVSQTLSAMRKLDTLMASWNAKGIAFPYPISSGYNTGSLDQDSGLPDYAIQAAYLALAIQIAPGFGKVISPDVKVSAKQAYDAMIGIIAMPRQVQITNLPSGAGWKEIDYPFLPPADTSPVQLNNNGDTLILGG